MSVLLEPGRIGTLALRNRLIRAGTSETMAGPDGEVTDPLIALYERLARGGVGAIFTGHLTCDRRGRYAVEQSGIHDDSLVPGLARLTAAVKQHGARIFAQLAHAGSQSRVPGNVPLAPSPVPNPLTGREVAGATEAELLDAVDAFAAAARRAVEAGFDGVHIHGANGYLISELSSPLTNRREDGWGGDAGRRDRFALEVVRAVRATVPTGFPVTIKLGMVDAIPGGLELAESVGRAVRLAEAGLDGIEVSCNAMRLPTDSARQYVAVDRRRAIADLLLHRAFSAPAGEAYFLPWAKALRERVDTTIVLVGGLRRTETMERILASGDADFIALARPLIREPDLVSQIERGRRGRVDCTSCNLCLTHEGHHSLRCWRTPRRRLLHHLSYRLSGGLRRGPVTALPTHD
jgi:2,4-dienoyl-CoA reductase-like NADH-dependent reductase (Old Yellow Enzyme family)